MNDALRDAPSDLNSVELHYWNHLVTSLPGLVAKDRVKLHLVCANLYDMRMCREGLRVHLQDNESSTARLSALGRQLKASENIVIDLLKQLGSISSVVSRVDASEPLSIERYLDG